MLKKIAFIIVLAIIFSSCTTSHNYKWNTYQIAPERITVKSDVKKGKAINIAKGRSNHSQIVLATIGPHRYYGNYQMLTDAIATQLSDELSELNVKLDSSVNKSLTIVVNRTNFEQGVWKFAATVDFDVEFGNGKVKSYSVRNSSPSTVPHAFDGAVAMSVLKIINDQEVLNYINE